MDDERVYMLWHNQRDRDPKMITVKEAFLAGMRYERLRFIQAECDKRNISLEETK